MSGIDCDMWQDQYRARESRRRQAALTERMRVVGRNLAVAGALCAALEMGDRNAREAYWHARSVWRPNVKGEAWPDGWQGFPR